MLWLASKAKISQTMLVLAACACAREALICIPAGENRPLLAIEAAEAWARGGNVNLDDVQCAACAAAAAADNAVNSANAYAAAAADAAVFVCESFGSNSANDIAYAAANAAHAMSAMTTSGYKTSLAKSADIVRSMIPWRVVADAIEASAV